MATPLNDFLALQSDSPFDPTSSLILADHLEEQGDATAAEALRGLVASGIPSLATLALWAINGVPFYFPEGFDRNESGLGEGGGGPRGYIRRSSVHVPVSIPVPCRFMTPAATVIHAVRV